MPKTLGANTMKKPSNQPHTEAGKFIQYYETWLSTHGHEAAGKWLAATNGSLSARLELLEKQIKCIEKIVKQSTPKPSGAPAIKKHGFKCDKVTTFRQP